MTEKNEGSTLGLVKQRRRRTPGPAKPGMKQLRLDVSEELYQQLEAWAAADDRSGGASEAARVLLKRHAGEWLQGAECEPRKGATDEGTSL